MKKIILGAMLICSTSVFAQGTNTGNSYKDENIVSLAERVTGLEKKNDAFNFYFNYAGAFRADQYAESDMTTGFFNKQLRLELRGNITDKFFYRLRHRMNRANDAKFDNFSKATDIMMVGYRPNDKFSLQMGKMCQIWGGFEFDENPMSIYQYSDMVDNMDNFMAGVIASWTPVPSQEFAFEISNANNLTFSEQYSWAASDNSIKRTNNPLTYILNWNGNFADGLVSTRWAIGSQTQAKSKYSMMVTLGQKLSMNKFQIYFDYMGAFDDIDRLGIVANETGCYKNVNYNSFIAKADYQFMPKWNFFVKGMYETASAPDVEELDNYRTSLGYYAGIEYYPDKTQDLRFSLTYQGRYFSYSKDSKAVYTNLDDHSDNRIEVGFMYRIKCY